MNIYFGVMLVSSLIASFSQILLKKSAGRKYDSFIKEYLNPYVIIGYGMMFLSLFLTIMAYKELEFTNVPVLESLGYVMVMILSYFFFKEKITKNKVIGMLFIFAGIFVYYL